jgi:hypothetical protein
MGIIFLVLSDCSIGVDHVSKWKIGQYTSNDCILNSTYDSYLGINPIVYILRLDQVKDVIKFVMHENIEENDSSILTDQYLYLLIEDYTNFRSNYKSKEFNVYLSESPLKLVHQYDRSFWVGGFFGQIFNKSLFREEPQRNILFFFGEENSQTIFDRKGKLYGYIYRLPILKNVTKLKFKVERGDTSQFFEADPKYIKIDDELYCEPRDY